MAPTFHSRVESIAEARAEAMRGVSWHTHPECPAFADLAIVTMNHWTFDGQVVDGELVVARAVADEVREAFAAIFAARFPIAQMKPIYHFGGDDMASMVANNCSAFNFRTISGTDTLSQHAVGVAVDINPVQNPWVRGDTVRPPTGVDYLERQGSDENSDPSAEQTAREGIITRPGPVTDAFDAIGWTWGGDWPEVKDYHHFQKYPQRGM